MIRTEEEKKAFLKALYYAHFGDLTHGQTGRNTCPAVFASAPGRVELAGNHTDHQGGRTISAAIDQRAYALAAPNGTDEIRVFMDGFGEASVRLSDLKPHANEQGASASLIRGMAAAYARTRKVPRGFTMVTCSDIPVGSGLSSSAAFEVLVGAVIRALGDPDAREVAPGSTTPALALPPQHGPSASTLSPSVQHDPYTSSPIQAVPHGLTTLALEGAWAERGYFGKPCGAQDQLASAYGGIALMDFAGDTPQVTPIDFDFDASSYESYLIDCRCDHSHHIDEYAAIPADMHAVAQHFACTRLEDVRYGTFLEQLQDVRSRLGDRAALRALHYFEETRRVEAQAEALQAGDFGSFLERVRLSGASSAQFLQNVSPAADGSGVSQPAMVVLALCAHLLDGGGVYAADTHRGAYRIHGGGFGGSILAFVHSSAADPFRSSMDDLLGYAGCMPVSIGGRGIQVERLS